MFRLKASRRRQLGFRPSRHFVRRLSSWLVLSTTLTLAAAKLGHASPLDWGGGESGNGGKNVLPSTGLGGTGLWNTSSTLWWDGVSLSDVAWNNGLNATDTAVFGGSAGTVSASAISAGGLTFN